MMSKARNARMISCPPRWSSWAILQPVEWQIRHDRGALVVEDDLVGAAKHPFHGLQEHALARDLGSVLVLVVDLQEARSLTGGVVHHLLLVALGGLQSALGLTARLRHHLVEVGVRFVLQALLVGARRLHVAEGVDHLARRIDLLQLHLIDLDASAVAVERAA